MEEEFQCRLAGREEGRRMDGDGERGEREGRVCAGEAVWD